MERIKDEYLDKIETVVSLAGREVLEIGCGDGTRSVEIAGRCARLRAIDPDEKSVGVARSRNLKNVTFEVASAEPLGFPDHAFDLVLYTLSFHHVPLSRMAAAIDEAIRVVRPDGHIIFLEPTLDGTVFDAEIYFDAWDGDERAEKIAAHEAISRHPGLLHVRELSCETLVAFKSVADFVEFMKPKQHHDEVQAFLERNHYVLNAGRRINICQPKVL